MNEKYTFFIIVVIRMLKMDQNASENYKRRQIILVDCLTKSATLNHNTHCEVASVSNLLRCETNAEAFKCKSHHILPRLTLAIESVHYLLISSGIFTEVRFNYSCNCPVVTDTQELTNCSYCFYRFSLSWSLTCQQAVLLANNI